MIPLKWYKMSASTNKLSQFILEHVRRDIDATYIIPIIGVILDDKIPKLKYGGPILVEKREGLVEAIYNYLTRHIRNMPRCHKDKFLILYLVMPSTLTSIIIHLRMF